MGIKEIIEALNYYFNISNSNKGTFIHKLSFENTRIGAYKEAQLALYYKELKKKAVLVDTIKLVGKVVSDDKKALTEDLCKTFIAWLITNKNKIDSYGI